MSNGIQSRKDALALAEADLRAVLHGNHEPESYENTLGNLLRIERELASLEGRPYAAKEDFPLAWDAGAPLPTLIQSDTDAYLLFLLRGPENRIGVVEFEYCMATTFGSPGEETFAGHPLHGSGFDGLGAMRVINSSWIEQLRKTNAVHSRHDEGHFADLQHFIFPFHDTIFECVARSYAVSEESGFIADAAKRAVDRLA